MTIKKIAIAAVAALTLSTFAVPANAAINAALSVDSVAVETGTTTTNPVLLPVPADNSVDATDALKIVVSDLANNTSVNIVATNVTLTTALATVDAPVTATSGSQSYTLNSLATTSVAVYAYTRSTTVGSVAITVGGNTTTYYLKGVAGPLKTLGLVAPTSGIGEKTVKVTVTGVDVFGNNTIAGATLALNTNGIVTTSGVVTGSEYTLTLPFEGTLGVSVYADGVVQASKTIAARNLLAELADKDAKIASLEAQVSALTIKLTAATSDAAAAKIVSDTTIADLKTKFNNLARQWNKKFPKQKVYAVK